MEDPIMRRFRDINAATSAAARILRGRKVKGTSHQVVLEEFLDGAPERDHLNVDAIRELGNRLLARRIAKGMATPWFQSPFRQ